MANANANNNNADGGGAADDSPLVKNLKGLAAKQGSNDEQRYITVHVDYDGGSLLRKSRGGSSHTMYVPVPRSELEFKSWTSMSFHEANKAAFYGTEGMQDEYNAFKD